MRSSHARRDARGSPTYSASPRWMVGRPDFRSDEFAADLSALKGKAAADYLVGRSSEADLPFRLVMFENRSRQTPQTARFFFNLATGGVHTVRFYLAGAKNLANVTHLTLDGQRLLPLHRDSVVDVAWSDRALLLVSSPRRNYFDLLHEKLGWG